MRRSPSDTWSTISDELPKIRVASLSAEKQQEAMVCAWPHPSASLNQLLATSTQHTLTLSPPLAPATMVCKTCEKKLSKSAAPDPFRNRTVGGSLVGSSSSSSGSSSRTGPSATATKGGSGPGTNKLLGAKNRYNPVGSKCKFCKQNVSQDRAQYCQGERSLAERPCRMAQPVPHAPAAVLTHTLLLSSLLSPFDRTKAAHTRRASAPSAAR